MVFHMAQKLKSLVILVLGLSLAFWFIKRVDWRTVSEHLQRARIWPLVVGAILINATIFFRSLRWRAFLAPIAEASLSNLFAATAIGFGALFVIGRAGSEIIRPAVLSLRERIQPSATIATILIERVFDTTAVVFLFAIDLLFFDLPIGRTDEWERLGGVRSIGLILLGALAVGLLSLAVIRVKADLVMRSLTRVTNRWPRKLAQPLLNFVYHLSEGLSVLLNLRALALTIFYTICVWSLISAATWFSLYAFGLNFSVSYVIFMLGFGLVGSLVPTPGGSAGAFHAAAAKSLEFLGLEPNLAASVAIVYHLIAFGPPFVLALYYLVRDDINLSQLREMIASEGQKHNLKADLSR